jgi:hypothetical protein
MILAIVGLSDLDFGPGLDFQRLVQDRFASPISYAPSFTSHEFSLVVSFSHFASRLYEDSVGIMLQSFLGGIDKDFRVSHLSGYMFRCLVFSKEVGFMIYRLRSFKCAMFDVFFVLWGEGVPNWCCELINWSYEEESKWFSPKSPHKSYAQVVKQSPKSVFKRISYPSDYYQKNFSSSQLMYLLRRSFLRRYPSLMCSVFFRKARVLNAFCMQLSIGLILIGDPPCVISVVWPVIIRFLSVIP